MWFNQSEVRAFEQSLRNNQKDAPAEILSQLRSIKLNPDSPPSIQSALTYPTALVIIRPVKKPYCHFLWGCCQSNQLRKFYAENHV